MLEESTSAVTSAEPVSAPVQPVVETITPEKIREFRSKRDRESIRKLIEDAEKTTSNETKPVSQEVKSEMQPQAEPPKTVESKKFKDKYKGKEIEVDDDDGYLGRKSLDELKKEAFHKRLYINEIEEKERQARSLADQNSRELEDYKRKFKEAQDKLAAIQAAPAPISVSKQPEQDIKTEVKTEMPKPPKKPAVKFDPLDEASQAEWQKYFDERADYDEKFQVYLQNLKPEVQVKTEIPPEFKSEFEQLKAQSQEYKSLYDTVKEQKQRSDFEESLNKQWNDRAEFQGTHKDYATKKPLKEINRELLEWSERLASLNGFQRPVKPYNIQDSEWYNYEKARTDLIARYAAGEKAIVESAGTFTPPDEYKQYMAVIELEIKRNKMIDEGILGKKATLHDAFVKDLDASGKMAETLSAMEKQSLLRGAKGVTEALKNVKEEYAVTLPPNVGQNDNSGEFDVSKMSKEEVESILSATGYELMRNPDLKRKKDLIMSKMSESTS